jgi:hypothetical protein
VAGQSLGGLLISADVLGTTWRPAFLVSVPAGLVLLAVAWRRLPAGGQRAQRLDLTGVALLSAAMLALVVPLVLGPDLHWPAWTWACLAVSGPAFAVLWAAERRVARRGGAPLIDPRLLARPVIAWGLAAQSAATATYFAVLFILALYLQQGLGRSATYSGLALVSWVAAFGTAYLALAPHPDQAVHGFAVICLALAGTALAAAAMAAVAVRAAGATGPGL